MFHGEARPNLVRDFALSATRRRSGYDFLDTSGEFHAEAARVAVDALAHVRQQFHPFGQPEGAGFAAVMPKRDHADDAVNTAIPRIAFVRPVVDVVFGGDGGVRFGHVFQRAAVVVQNANAAELVSPIGLKYRNVVRIGPNCAALDEDERVCIASAVLHADESKTFERHGIGFAFAPITRIFGLRRDKIGEKQRNNVAARAVNYDAVVAVVAQ